MTYEPMSDRAIPGLDGKVAAITGSGSGLGLATARIMASSGATVAILDVDRDAGARVAAEIPDSFFVHCDVTDAASVEAAADAVWERTGTCDVLVNNAGVMTKTLILEETEEAWDRMMAINVRGYFLCTRAFGRRLVEAGRGGAIVNIASIGAKVPTVGAGAYCVTKAGVVALTEQCAIELGPLGIRTNAVSPGFMRTAMTEANYAAPGVAEGRSAMVPLRRIAALEEVAAAVAYLASDQASYVNGVDLVVDGGFTRTTSRSVPHAKEQATA